MNVVTAYRGAADLRLRNYELAGSDASQFAEDTVRAYFSGVQLNAGQPVGAATLGRLIIVGNAFIGLDAAEQAATLVHEMIHSLTGWNDVEANKFLGIAGAEALTAADRITASTNLQKFIENDCKN